MQSTAWRMPDLFRTALGDFLVDRLVMLADAPRAGDEKHRLHTWYTMSGGELEAMTTMSKTEYGRALLVDFDAWMERRK
jgi:hypothetical protein